MLKSAFVRQDLAPSIASINAISIFSVPGRLMLASGREVACRASEITSETAEIVTHAMVEPAETVVCFPDNIGVLPGRVNQVTAEGFVLDLRMPEFRRGAVAARFEWHARRSARTAELRAALRIVPVHRSVEIKLGQGIVLRGEIQDISRTGAAIVLTTAAMPFVGAHVQIGTPYATVMRHFEGGIAIQFREPFKADSLDKWAKL